MTNGYQHRQRRPTSLRGEQLAGHPVTRARDPIPVRAWIGWQDGTTEQVEGVVTEWTSRAVHVYWKTGHRVSHEAWVWVGAVVRVRDGTD